MKQLVLMIAVLAAGCTELGRLTVDPGEADRLAKALAARSEAVATRWETFRSQLSHDQTILLDQLFALQNAESRHRFLGSLSTPQRGEVLAIMKDLQTIKGIDTRLREEYHKLQVYRFYTRELGQSLYQTRTFDYLWSIDYALQGTPP